MKILTLLVGVVFLAGCSTPVPVKQQWPAIVTELQEKCPQLKIVEGERVAITDLLKVIVENYTTYYQCANKVEGWNEWYNKQKEIFEKANK
jgi:uncharacterized lipoprotein YajG